MARIAIMYRVVRSDGSRTKRPDFSKKEVEATRLLDYQQTYKETEQNQAAESGKTNVSRGSEEPSNS